MANEYSEFNPIRSVNGSAIPCPSAYTFILSDVSAADAGRTEDTVMHKNKLGEMVKIELSWQNVPHKIVYDVLNAFDKEYFTVTYYHPKFMTWKTSTFYVGDRTSPMYNNRLGLWQNLNLNIIERAAK